MTIKVGVSGLGRIGRCVLRAYFEYSWKDIEIVAINAPGDVDRHVHLLKYDSTHGTFAKDVKANESEFVIDGKKMVRFDERDPAKIAWDEAGVDVVLECTGAFKKKEDVSKHLRPGVKRVIISAPSPDADSTIVYGVNHQGLKDESVISVGSCTTNCLAPVADVLNKEIGIVKGFMTTVHAFTNDQNVLDGSHKDLRRARTAMASMIPTSTGAAKALGLVLPELKGKLDGTAIRVPTPNVSMVDLTFEAPKPVTADEVNSLLKKAAEGSYKGVIAYNDEPLVSIDFNHHPASSIFDATQTYVVGDNMVRVASWYDNEWGFSCRMLDVAALLG